MRRRRVVLGLIHACHPGPSLTVTVVAGLLGAAQGISRPRLGVLMGAVGAGQLGIGWGNDALDASRDLRVGRVDKPVVVGEVTRRQLWVAAGVATAICGVLTRRLGGGAGVVHGVLVVGSGWAYNAGLKRTRLSVVPYGVAFGALPHLSTLSEVRARPAPGWQSVSGALLGVAAHCLNVLPDRADDARTGVVGTSHRWSESFTRRVAVGSALAATVTTLRGSSAPGRVVLVTTALGLPAAGAALRGEGKVPFMAVECLAGLNAGLLVLAARTHRGETITGQV